MKAAFKTLIRTNRAFRPLLACFFGTQFANRLFWKKAFWPHWTILKTGEFHNFTYNLTPLSMQYLAETISFVTGKPAAEIEGYIREPLEDQELIAHVASRMKSSFRSGASQELAAPFGRRLGWYAFVRATKPQIVVETGVERGHGSVLLCSALLRNGTGRYYGTDINPHAGFLLSGKYAEVGKILYGDSIERLQNLDEKIDLFINDSDHSGEYEAREYRVVEPKLAPGAVILGDNGHVTDSLAVFARETGRHFLYFREVPEDHWYPGAGIGIALK